jgi:D-glycero-D-manno-heptose 1,7-bisphosphate phosphatase
MPIGTTEVPAAPSPGPTPTGRARVVFVDRDGTLNPDLHYLRESSRLELYPGVPQGIRLLHMGGFRVICVTNQSGVERGFYTDADVASIHARVQAKLATSGARIDAFYYCPHAPERGCDCRKPRTALFRQAAREWNVDFETGAIIGDRSLDIEVGETLGLLTALVPEPGHEDEVDAELDLEGVEPDLRAPTFLGAAMRILARG